MTDTALTSATYTGAPSQTYGFYSVATDNVGNTQATPNGAQAATTTMSNPTITWNNPPNIVYGTVLGAAQLDATANVPGTFSYTLANRITSASGALLTAGSGQTLNVTFTPTDTVHYNTVSSSVTINVLKVTPTITWSNPSFIVAGTALGSGQLDAIASTAGTFNYTLADHITAANGAVLSIGTGQVLDLAFTPTDAADYNSTSASVTIDVAANTEADVVASWIEGLQLPGGAILEQPAVYGQPGALGPTGDGLFLVDPYFANLGVIGLLQANAPDALQTASRWISVYLNNLPASGFINRLWAMINGTLETPIEQGYSNPDSDDSYGATFLSLCLEYVEAGGNLSAFQSLGISTKLPEIAQALLGLQASTGIGLTSTFPGNGVEYLADNSEVYAGFQAMATLETLEPTFFTDSVGSAAYSQGAATIYAVIQSDLVDTQGRFEINLNPSPPATDSNFTPGTNPPSWYPDFVVVWPALLGVISPSSVQAQDQLAAIDSYWNGTDGLDWTDNIVDGGGFVTPQVGYAALIGNDVTQGQANIDWVYAEDFTGQANPPPITVDEAGWLLRGLNEIAGNAPTSTVAALPAVQSAPAFPVSWSGTDYAGGPGVASYDVFVSDDGGPYTEWLTNTTQTSATFTGTPGDTYGFFSVATDLLDNIQETPTAAQATTMIQGSQTISFGTLANQTYGVAPFAVSASASSGLAVTFSIVAGGQYASISGDTITLLGATPTGTVVTVAANQQGDANHTAAATVGISPSASPRPVRMISFGTLANQDLRRRAIFAVEPPAPPGRAWRLRLASWPAGNMPASPATPSPSSAPLPPEPWSPSPPTRQATPTTLPPRRSISPSASPRPVRRSASAPWPIRLTAPRPS